MGFWAQKKKSFITKKKLEDKKVKTLFIGILFPNVFWPTVSLLWEKIVLGIEKNFWNFEDEGQEFAKKLRSVEQFIRTVKGQFNFLNRMLF